MKKYTTVILLFLVSLSFGQGKYAADKYFKEYAYVKSAELYHGIYKKGDSTKLVVSRLADSYYFNTNTIDAERWYEKLFSLYEKEGISSEYYFRYAQCLKSNGKYKESDVWLLKIKQNNKGDSRVMALLNKTNYFDEYSNNEKVFVNVLNVSTNTSYSDYGVSVVEGGVLFSSTRPNLAIKKRRLYKWNQQPFLNIYFAKDSLMGANSSVKGLDLYAAEKLENVNTRYHEASAIVTKDGNTMYFTRDNYDGKKLGIDKKRTSHLKIYKAELSAGEWTNIQELPFNSNSFSSGLPALNADETELYFVSDMPGGFGATDLYKVAVLENGDFGKPENLGASINTESREMFPYISANNVLYFSSDGHIGLGALDVFESKISSNGYSNPSNLGNPINSPRDDFSFVIVEEQRKGYFSSNRKGGKGDDDIYSFAVYHCKENITGVVFDSNSKTVLRNAQVKLVDHDGNVIKRTNTDDKGVYSFESVDCETRFIVFADKVDYKSGIANLLTTGIDGETLKINVPLTPLVIEDQIVLSPILFDFDKSNIREDAAYELENIVTVMNAHPKMHIKIESHTDARGEKEYNRNLSDRRAKSTRDYIISRGIAADRIESAIGYGEDQLLNDCNDARLNTCSKEAHQKNRRSYFYIIKSTKK